MNGNEVLRIIRIKGMEKGVVEVLLLVAEEQRDIKRQINEMAQAFEALVRVQTMLNGVADGLKLDLDKLKKKDDDPSSTRGMLS